MPRKGGSKKGRGGHSKSPNKQRATQNHNRNRSRNSSHENSPHKQNGVRHSSSNNPAIILKERGNEAFQEADFPRAIELYTQAIGLDNQNHTIFANRSVALLKSEQFERAIQDAMTCIELQPTWSKGYLRKASVFEEMQRWDDAKEAYSEGLDICEEKETLQESLGQMDNKRLQAMDMQDKIVGGVHSQSENFRILIDWLLQNGARFPKLFLKHYTEEYRAIHAIERISKDEDICFIPHANIMTSDVAKGSEIGRALIESKVELRSKHSYLASYLLQERERGDASQWYIYISILPKEFNTIPLFFDDEMRQLLTGSISLKKIDDRLESLRLEHEHICNAVPEFARFTYEDFVWARLVVITRIFGLVIENVKTDGLVPMADMLNHKRPRETKWTYDQKRRGFVITALQNIRQNAEIFDSYGRKCNSRFFVNYGFSLESNLDNEALMTFELPANDPQFSLKARYLGNTGLRKDYQIPMYYKEKKVKECFSFIRFLHAQGTEMLMIAPPDGVSRNPIDNVPPLSVRNEQNVLLALAVAAQKSLELFPGSLEHDNELLADEENYPRFSNIRNAILMRRGEKQVLTFYVNLARLCMPLLKMNLKKLQSKITQMFRTTSPDDPLAQYVREVVVRLVQHQP